MTHPRTFETPARAAMRLEQSARRQPPRPTLRGTRTTTAQKAPAGGPRTALASVLQDVQGAISVEYVTLVGVFGLGVSASIITLGMALVERYALVRDRILMPFP